MGTAERKKREKNERRNHILKAAKSLFKKRGFSGVTMSQIARKADYKPSTLYFYFKNKEELYAAISVHAIRSLLESLEKAVLDRENDPEGMMLALKDEMGRLIEQDTSPFLDILNFQTSEVYRDLSDNMVLEIKAFATQTIRFLAGIFEQGIRQGVFKEYPPIVLADILWSTFSGLIVWEESKKALAPDKNFAKKTFEVSIDLLLQGLKK